MQCLDDNKRILVIDDNPAIHGDFRKILIPQPASKGLLSAEADFFRETASTDDPANIQIDFANQGKGGVNLAARAIRENNPYHVAFVDIHMPPGWSGFETIEELWKVDPHLQVVICAAYSSNTWKEIRRRLGNTDRLMILRKPFDAVEVSQLALTLIGKWRLTHLADTRSVDLKQLVDERTACLRKAEVKIKQQRGFLELATSVAQVGYWRWDLERNQREWSADMFTILGAEAGIHTKTSEPFIACHHPKDQANVRRKMDQAIDRKKPIEFKARVIHPNGELRHVLTRIACETDMQEKTTALFGVTRDITRDEQSVLAVQHAAMHDPLTNLGNRSKFHDRLAQSLELTNRYNRSMAIVLLDLDNFKAVNDTYGHPFGDLLLKQFALRLHECVRACDTTARLGGDEFAIIQSPVERPELAARLVQRLHDKMKQPFEIHGRTMGVEFSGGIAVAPTDGLDSEELLRSAGLALCNAKHDGGGNYRFFEGAMDDRVKHRRRVETELRAALENDELELHYQPIFDSATNKVTCLEGLLRWNHPERGTLPPGEFITIAETTGLILPIGNWVIRQACKDAANLPKDVHVAVNVSAVQFQDHRLTSTVMAAASEFGIEASQLEIEVTESVMLADGEETLQQLHRLQQLGIKIAMDDFGTGYSSLSYLRRFPFDRLKLDRTFVMDSTTELDAQAIVRAVASLGSSMGIETTAEGVETTEHLKCITAEGYTHFQGFLRGRPVPFAEIDLECRSPPTASAS